MARILAKALNCAQGPTPRPCGHCDSCREVAGQGSVDVLEIDGASNNSVEDVRSLREKVLYGGVRDRYKVYIIDEVHMLSGAAFNALLKTLEEPPPHVIFIFATTEAQKIPATILSRTQRFDFRRIGARDLVAQLRKILDAEKVPCTQEALSLVARAAGGSLRDAQTLLDQVISFCGTDKDGGHRPVSAEDVLQVLGGVEEGQAAAALLAALEGRLEAAFQWVRELYERGADLRLALATLSDCLRGMVLVKSGADPAEHSELLPETLQALATAGSKVGLPRLLSLLKAAGEAESQMRYSSNQRLALETLLIRFSPRGNGGTLGELFDQLSLMEERLDKGQGSPMGAPPASAAEAPPTSVPTLAAAVPTPPAKSPAPREPGLPVAAVEAIEEVKPQGLFGLESVKAGWERVAEKASEISALLGAAVRDLDLAAADEKGLQAKVRNALQKDTLDGEEPRKQLEGILREVYGRKLAFRLALPTPDPKAGQKNKYGLSQEEIDRVMTPEVKRLQELFDAEIVEIKKI
jgi:DNA polymerase-3 subunit gamma/tau